LLCNGEDMVELVIDPGFAARSTEDLYHLAVKANGVVLTERGVHTDPPLGAASPWPVAARVAVAKLKDAWSVEMRIPLTAFGGGRLPEVWGINFARFATVGAEASNWAEAPRYFYDSRNLGTMFLARPPEAATRPSNGVTP
jgi:hypothetical protein